MASLDTAASVPSPTAPARYRKKRRPTISWFQWLTLAVVAVFVVVPLFVTVLGGFKEIGELRSNPFGLPQSWDPVRFIEILTASKYFQSMGNSLIIAVGSVVLSLVVASMTAFAFAQIKFFGSRYLMAYLMLGLLFPSATGILPLFLKMRDLGMLDSLWGIIVVQVAFSISFSVLLFYNFFKELPKELIDAARMDNCGYIRIYWYVTLPLCLPIIATVGVFNFVGSWNSFLLPLIVINTDARYT